MTVSREVYIPWAAAPYHPWDFGPLPGFPSDRVACVRPRPVRVRPAQTFYAFHALNAWNEGSPSGVEKTPDKIKVVTCDAFDFKFSDYIPESFGERERRGGRGTLGTVGAGHHVLDRVSEGRSVGTPSCRSVRQAASRPGLGSNSPTGPG